MEIYAYYWKTEEIPEPGNFYTELRIYGIDEKGRNTCVRVVDCKTRVILEFKDEKYLEKNFSSIKNKLSSIVYKNQDKNSIKLVYKRKLYNAHVNPDGSQKLFPFIEIKFSSRIGLFGFRKKIPSLNLKTEIKFHEIPATTEIQFIVSRNLQPSGWIKILKPVENLMKITSCECEYIVNKNQIVPIEKNDPVDVKIMAWDIEAKCKDIGKNPGKNVDDCVFQISCVFSTYLTKKFKKVLLTLGKCARFDEDTDIKIFKSERELILGFVNLVKTEQPNIITGWNIFNFDINFMINRAEQNMCLGELCSFGFYDGEIKQVKWESKAFLTTNIKYIDCEGVLSIDLIEVVRREYKLDSYSLNNVSKHFLKDEKDDITFKDLMYAYSCLLNNSDDLEKEFTKVGKYCVQDSKLVLDLFDHLQTWLSLSEMSKTTSTPIMQVHLNGQQKKFYNQIFRYCYGENIVVQSDVYKSKDTERYTGAYVIDPVPGLYEYVVPLDFASLYPSIMIAYNFDYTTLVKDDDNFPEDSLTILEWEDHILCEHDPLIIQKKILSDLIDSTPKGPVRKDYISQRAILNKKLASKKDIICEKRFFKFLKSEKYGKGVLPTIIQNLLDARKKVRKEMKSVTDERLLKILNQRQLSYKVSANSMYGATGVKEGALPFMPVAMCVTHTGRESIKKASEIIKNLGGSIVYGDTDSNYVMFKDITGTHEEICSKIWDRAIKVAENISENYPKPMKIEFEEVIYNQFLILTKKRYMYYSCNREGVISEKIGQKGVLLARRDNSRFLKKVYENTVVNIFQKKTTEEILDNIFEWVIKLMTRQIEPRDLTITKSVNNYNDCEIKKDEKTGKFKMGNYIVGTNEDFDTCVSRLPAQVQLEIKLIKRGEEKSEGSRLEYLILNKPNVKKQCDKIEEYKFFLKYRDILFIDYNYYITHLHEPIQQLIFDDNNAMEKILSPFIKKNKCIEQMKNLFRPKIVLTK